MYRYSYEGEGGGLYILDVLLTKHLNHPFSKNNNNKNQCADCI